MTSNLPDFFIPPNRVQDYDFKCQILDYVYMFVEDNKKTKDLWGGTQNIIFHHFYGQASLRVANRTNMFIGGQRCPYPRGNTTAPVSDRVLIQRYHTSDQEDTPWVTEQPHRQLDVPRKMPVAIVGSKEDLCRKI